MFEGGPIQAQRIDSPLCFWLCIEASRENKNHFVDSLFQASSSNDCILKYPVMHNIKLQLGVMMVVIAIRKHFIALAI